MVLIHKSIALLGKSTASPARVRELKSRVAGEVDNSYYSSEAATGKIESSDEKINSGAASSEKLTLHMAIKRLDSSIKIAEIFLETQPWHEKADEAATKLGEMRAMRDHYEARLTNSTMANRQPRTQPT